jgi:hypothetical protein
LNVTKTRQRQRKKKRAAELRAGIDRSAERMRAILRNLDPISPEEQAEEDRISALEDAKLVEMFGEKEKYSDFEIDLMVDALKAEGVLSKAD